MVQEIKVLRNKAHALPVCTAAAVICGCHPWAEDARTAAVTTVLHPPPHGVFPAPPVTAVSYGM